MAIDLSGEVWPKNMQSWVGGLKGPRPMREDMGVFEGLSHV